MNTRALVSSISGKSLLAFAGIVLLLGVVTGQAAAATVSGLVTNVTSRDPGPGVPNLFVVATTPAPNFTFLAEAQTNESGSYTISLPNMPGSTQFLVFVDLTGTRLVAALNDTIEKTLTFTGANLGPVDFKLVDGVKLSGAVTVQSTGKGASGVIVFATNPSLGFKFLGQATTGADGTYGLLVPPNETAELAVDTQGKTPGTVVDPAFLDVLVPAQPTPDQVGKNFSLIPGVTVQGSVVWKDNLGYFHPISNALVEAFYVETTGWKWLDDDVTGLNGFYSVTVAAAKWDQILLRVTASGFVERRVALNGVTLVSPTTTVDIVLSTSVQISGQVTDASYGNPIAGVPVEAVFDPYILDVGATDLNGFYTLDVDPNKGLVTIHVDATSLDYFQPPDGEVLVGNLDFTGVNFALTQAVRITGTVTDADSVPPGAAIGGARVSAIKGAIVLAFALTDSWTDPYPGKYLLKVAVNPGDVVIHVDAGTSYETANRPVTVPDQWPLTLTEDFALKRVVQTDSVTITFAGWSKNVLTVFATSTLKPAPTLTATAVDSQGFTVISTAMKFSSKRNQYELRVRTTDKFLIGGRVTVTSNKGGSASVPIPFSGACVNRVCP